MTAWSALTALAQKVIMKNWQPLHLISAKVCLILSLLLREPLVRYRYFFYTLSLTLDMQYNDENLTDPKISLPNKIVLLIYILNDQTKKPKDHNFL